MRNRRLLAKIIDFIAFAGFVSIGTRWGGSLWTGFALGAAYLLAADALGMSSKAWFGLGVIDVATGARCSLAASALRNTPWLAAPLFRTAVASFSDGAPSPQAMTIARAVLGVLSIGVAITLWRGLGDGTGRHWADLMAGTRVVKAGGAVPQTRAQRSAARGHTAAGATSTPEADHDAVDFDDADDVDGSEGKPTRAMPRPPAKPKRSPSERDAVDFDDAAN